MDAKRVNSLSSTTRSVALCQLSPKHYDPQVNTRKIITWMERAAKSGADIALFGELFLSGCDLDNIHELSESKDGPAATAIAKAAKELGIATIYGYSEVEYTHYYNSIMFINSRGERLANYRQAHIWPAEANQYTPGDVLTVVDWEGLRVGLGGCVDVCIPDFARAMVTNGGAQLLVIAAALVGGPLHEKIPSVLVPARALENSCYIAYVNLAGESYLGMSKVCSPLGVCLASARNTEETLLMATIPLNTQEGVPFHYLSLRRPELYNAVVAYETEVPWKREKPEHVQEFFKHRASYYDDQMDGIYNGPRVAARALAGLVAEKSKEVLDVAAGTGLVGKALFDKGFTNIVALDRSEEMLERLSEKNIYTRKIVGTFEEEARKLSSESFHVCISVGAFLTMGFLDPVIAVEEMIRLVEVGGFILLLWNAMELEQPQCQATKENLGNVLEKVVNNGLCECVQREVVPNYLEECEGSLCIMKKVQK